MVCYHNSHFNWLLLFLFFLHQPKRSQHIQPHRKRKRTQQRRHHNHPGTKRPLMSHIPCHNKTADRRSRSKHHQNRNQLFISKSKNCCYRQKNRTKSNQLHKHCHNCRLHFRCRFPQLKCRSHRHQTHRRRCRPDIGYNLM